MKLAQKMIAVIVAASLLLQQTCWAEPQDLCLAPHTIFPTQNSEDNKYQLIINRFTGRNSAYREIPADQFEEFLRRTESLFNDYISYSAFPYNQQMALQFVESEKNETRYLQRRNLELFSHMPKREALKRRDGMSKLESMLREKLETNEYVAVNLMGRPGVGKSTMAGKIKEGSASLRSDEILVVSVDGFKRNDISLVNKLISNRKILNIPLRGLSEGQYAVFERISAALQFPLARESDKSFLDFYLVAEAREEDSAENIRVLRRRKLWNHIGSNIMARDSVNRAIKSLSDEEYREIQRVAGDMQLDLKKIKRDSGKSFLDLYMETDRDEFLQAVEHKERARSNIRLFVVEGTYSYQGQDLFNPRAERLMEGDENHLIRVMVEVEESIVRQRIRDRNRSDMEEMLALYPAFDAIFKASIDMEREFCDLIIDNTESTDIFQIRITPSGIKAQFGIVSETARTTLTHEMLDKEPPPDIYFLPAEFFKGGRNYADLEFLIYYKFFIKGGKRLTVIGTEEQKERIMEFMRLSLFGEDASKRSGISAELKNFLKSSSDYFAVKDKGGNILPTEAFIDFHVVDIGQKATINIAKDGRDIALHVEHLRLNLFSMREEGYDAELIEIDYRVPPPANYNISADIQKSIQNAPMNVMSIAPMGCEDGFAPGGDYTNFIVWLEGVGIHVDPSPLSLTRLEQSGIDFDDIPYVLLTHNHADHDSGLIRKMLMKKRIKLLTARPVFEDFVAKAKAILGKDFPVEEWIDWIELREDKTNEIGLPGGRKVYIDIRYNLHSIPTIGFVISYQDKKFGYSGDIFYDPELIKEWLDLGKLSFSQAEKLLYFFWDERGNPKVDMLFHEAGIPPLHTKIDALCQIPESMYGRLYVLHLSAGKIKDKTELKEPVTDEKIRHFQMLKKLEAFNTRVLIPADEEMKNRILAKTLDNVNLLSHLDQEAKMHVFERGMIKSFKPGETIIFEGESAETFYIVLSGRADVIAGGEKIVDANGAKLLLGGRQAWTFYPKDSFGEVALIEGGPRTATVRAASNVTALEICKKDFLDLVYSPLKSKDSAESRNIKYCLEEWIQRYSDNLIESISDVSLSQIAKLVKLKPFAKGDKLLNEGDFGDAAYIIMRGNVGVYSKGRQITRLSTGEIVGEMALLNFIQRGIRAPRNADCVAETDVQVLEIDKDTLAAILHTYPGLDRGLRYEYRLRQLALGAHYISPHSYSDVRPRKAPQALVIMPQEKMADRMRISAGELAGLSDGQKIEAFLNNIFSYSEFFPQESFSEEFYNPPVYRENLINFIKYLGMAFSSFQTQRFYHKFIEVSLYDENTKAKKLYRFVRAKNANIYRWAATDEPEVTTGLPSRPVSMLLINLESEQYEGVKGTPENVKTLQAYVEAYNVNCNVSLMDCQWPENDVNFIMERIKTERPEIVCVSSTFGCLKELEHLLQAIRKMPHRPLAVIGGLTATWSYEYLLEKYPETICVQREGEEALSGLVDIMYKNGLNNGSIVTHGSFGAIPNLIYSTTTGIYKNSAKNVDLDTAPAPSRKTQLERMRHAGFLMNSEGARRGCQYGGCAFCTRTHGRARPMRLTRVVADFEEYLRGGASFIVYADEDFLPDDPADMDKYIDRIETVKEKYRNDYFLEYGVEPQDMSFYIAVRARTIWKEGNDEGNKLRLKMLERLKKVGLVKIFLGVESGSPVQLKKTYNKEADLVEMKKAIEIIRSLGIQVVTGFITFDPTATLGVLRDNINFAREMGLVHGDPLTEPINPFKQFRAQTGSALVNRCAGIGLISSDPNPDTLMHDLVYRSDHIRMVMGIGRKWDGMISVLEYSLKGVVWHAEQSAGEMEKAKLFIDLFNWLREKGYVLLEELRETLSQNIIGHDTKIDMFFDRLSGLPIDKALFELRRSIFPHTDIYGDIKTYIDKHRYDNTRVVDFLKSFFKGNLPDDWNFRQSPQETYRGWIKDISEDMALRMLSVAEKEEIRARLHAVFKIALQERLNRLKLFMDSGWEPYYSASLDAVGRGMKFKDLLKKVIEEHESTLSAVIGMTDILSDKGLPELKIYYRISLKDYFQYRHPDMSKPLGVLIKLADFLKDNNKTAALDKIFLYPDGALKCENLREGNEADRMKILHDTLRQIFLSSYDPFNSKKGFDAAAIQFLLNRLEQEKIEFKDLKDKLINLYRIYALSRQEKTTSGLLMEFTDKTLDKKCEVEISATGLPAGKKIIQIKGENIPASMKLYLPGLLCRAGKNGLPVITDELTRNITQLTRQTLDSYKGNGIEGHREAIMAINGLVSLLQTFDDDKRGKWLDSICDAVDEAILPLTVYLPDTDEGRKSAQAASDINFVFVNPILYDRLWPGIQPHLEDIIYLATPGILDDFPKMLAMIKEGKLKPDIVQLIYELFHNRVNLDAFVRNENFDEVIKFTTNEMRVMPRKTPVLVIPKDHPLLKEYFSGAMPDFIYGPDGKARFLLHPYTYKKWKEKAIEFPRPGCDMEWTLTYPTSSHRTLFIFGKDRNQKLVGKAHSIIWAGPAMRRLRPNSVDHTFRVSERIRQSIDSRQLPESIKDSFAYFAEQGFTLHDTTLYEGGIGVIYRSLIPYPYVKGAEERFLIPTFAFHNNSINVPDNTAQTPLTQLIDWNTKDTGEDQVDYFTRTVLKPLYAMLFYYIFEQGILLEPHGQNFYVEVDKEGKICRLVFKDWQSAMVNLERRLDRGLSKSRTSIIKHLMGEEASEPTSLSVVFDHYWGNYLMRQLLETLVERYHGEMSKISFRQTLLKRFKDVFEEYYNAYPDNQFEFSDIALRHAKKPPTDRSNTVDFTASGAPLLRSTGYERMVEKMAERPALRNGRITVPVAKIIDSNARVEGQEYLPDSMSIDFDRVRLFAKTGDTWQDARNFSKNTVVKNKDFIAVYPEDYDSSKKYDLIIVFHGKGSHPAQIIDISEKLDRKDTIVVIPRAPFRFGKDYTWFHEGTEEEHATKEESVNFVKNLVGFFEKQGTITDRVCLLGVSEGGYLAQLVGMRMSDKIKEVIAINAPFRESYFEQADMDRIVSGRYPDILIVQYANDKVVNIANAQRAVTFYSSKGLRPSCRYYSRGYHNRVNIEMAEDIRNWLDSREGRPAQQTENRRAEGALKNAIVITKMAEKIVPVLLLALPKEDTRKGLIFRHRLDLITSMLCYCRFQAELGLKEPKAEAGVIRPESVKWFDVDTAEWLEGEIKSLLKEAMESDESLSVDNGLDSEITYIDGNEQLMKDMIGAGKEEALIRVPIEILEDTGSPQAKEFIDTLQQAPHAYVELYSVNGIVDARKAQERYGIIEKPLPAGFVKTRQNTITLFIAPRGNFTLADFEISVRRTGLNLKNTILSPVRLGQDQTGLIKGLLLGFRLLTIARHERASGNIDTEFVKETIEQYRKLCLGHGIETFDLINADIISLAIGDINEVAKALKKLIKLLPITKYNAVEIEKAYECATRILIAA